MFDNKCVKNKFNSVSSSIRGAEVKHVRQKKPRDREELPTIRCTCGAKILIVPDITAMSLAIQKHKAEHKEVDEDFLIQQLFETVAKRKK
jgi:hypothetical protein